MRETHRIIFEKNTFLRLTGYKNSKKRESPLYSSIINFENNTEEKTEKLVNEIRLIILKT